MKSSMSLKVQTWSQATHWFGCDRCFQYSVNICSINHFFFFLLPNFFLFVVSVLVRLYVRDRLWHTDLLFWAHVHIWAPHCAHSSLLGSPNKQAHLDAQRPTVIQCVWVKSELSSNQRNTQGQVRPPWMQTSASVFICACTMVEEPQPAGSMFSSAHVYRLLCGAHQAVAEAARGAYYGAAPAILRQQQPTGCLQSSPAMAAIESCFLHRHCIKKRGRSCFWDTHVSSTEHIKMKNVYIYCVLWFVTVYLVPQVESFCWPLLSSSQKVTWKIWLLSTSTMTFNSITLR